MINVIEEVIRDCASKRYYRVEIALSKMNDVETISNMVSHLLEEHNIKCSHFNDDSIGIVKCRFIKGQHIYLFPNDSVIYIETYKENRRAGRFNTIIYDDTDLDIRLKHLVQCMARHYDYRNCINNPNIDMIDKPKMYEIKKHTISNEKETICFSKVTKL